MDPDQAPQNMGPDLDLNCLRLKESFENSCGLDELTIYSIIMPLKYGLDELTIYSIIMPLKYHVFENIMEIGASALLEQMLHFP